MFVLGLLALIACEPPWLPDSVVADLGARLCELGHPHAQCGAGRVSAQSHGPLSFSKSKERWVDVTTPYVRRDKTHEMTVRVLVKKLSPCSVSTNVIADDGPNPVLLDNAIAAALVGDAICRELGR